MDINLAALVAAAGKSLATGIGGCEVDINLAALAATVGESLVRAMVADGWAEVRNRFARIFSVGDPGREQVARRDLDATCKAVRGGRLEAAVAVGRWQGRLEMLLEDHPEIAAELKELVASLVRSEPQAGVVRQSATAGVGSTINQAGHDVNTTSNVRNSRTSFGGPMVLIAVIAVLLVVGGTIVPKIIVSINGGGNGISKDASCREYLQASTEDREHAVKTIGLQVGATGAGNPMARLNVDYICGETPGASVGKVIAQQNY